MRQMNNYLGLIFLLNCMLIFSCGRMPEKKVSVSVPPDGSIRLSEARMQLANIRVEEAGEGSIGREMILTGRLKLNEQNSVSISSRTDGKIEKLFFKATGEKVNPGDSLYSIYSDELVAAEREYFNLQRNNWNALGQYPPSLLLENKLIFLGMMPAQMEELRKDGRILFTITILSQAKGIIRSVNVTEGQYVEAGTKMFELAENNSLWLEALAYPGDLNSLKAGMDARAIIPGDMNREIRTKITSVNPVLEAGKNVTVVRSVIDNSDKKLYPGMMALLKIKSPPVRGIVIPLSAVINDEEGSKVWVRDENGIFSPRSVTTGIQSSDSVLVLSGLEVSDMVVSSGAYLLNSEKILKKGNTIKDIAEKQ